MSYKKEENKKLKVAFDVDGTLITFHDKPRYDTIELYHHFKRLGCYMIVWSGGGEDYARTWADKLGLEPNEAHCKFGYKGPTPDIAFDDEKVELGKTNIIV